MDESVWQNEPYTQQDLTNQVNWAAANLPDGQQILSDATNYVAGINAYIATAESPLNAADDAAGRVRGDRAAARARSRSRSRTSSRSRRWSAGSSATAAASSCRTRSCTRTSRPQFGPSARTWPGSPELIRARRRPRRSTSPRRKRRRARASRSARNWLSRRVRSRHPGAPGHPPSRQGGARRRPDRGATERSRTAPGSPRSSASSTPPTPRRRPPCAASRSRTRRCPQPSKAVQATMALPDPGSVQYVNPVAAGAVPAGESRSATAGSKARPASAGPGLSRALLAFGRGDVERAAGQRRGQRERPSARGDGAAGQLLQPRRS